MFAGTGSLTTTFVAVPDPGVLDDHRVGDRVARARASCPTAGEFDFTIVRTGGPMNVWTGGELTVWPLAASSAWSTIGLGAPSGTRRVNVSGGDTITLLDVAAGNATGPLAGRGCR